MDSTVSTRRAIAPIAILLAACGEAAPAPPIQENPYTLTIPGDANLTLHPGDRRTLAVLLAGESAGPMAKARVHFAFRDGQAAGSSVEAADALTDATGVATVRFTAGPRPAAAPVQLVVSAPDLGPDPVAFNFSIVALRRTLEIVPAPGTRVGDEGMTGATSASVSSAVALRVRELDADTAEPIAGDTIVFTLPPVANARWSAGVSRAATAVTGVGGRAQAFLVTTAAAEGPWQVVAQSAGGGPAVYFNVTVQPGSPDMGAGCEDPASPCPEGLACVAGACEPPGSGCDPDAPACASGQCCDPSARICRACVADAAVPDVTGLWLTRHDFRIREALPLAVQEIFKALRLMDQTLLGKLTLPGLPGWLQEIVNAFVARLLQQYLPGWLQMLVHLGDDLATILGNLRAEGAMRLSRNPDEAHLKGAEVWTSLVFYWLPLCEGAIAGDPAEPPECARIDVVTSDSGLAETAQCKGQALPSIRVQISPFTASVTKRESGYALEVGPRQVKLEMRKILLILVDQLITAVTAGEYRCIEEATGCAPGTGCLVDCDGLGADVEGATEGIVDSGTVQQLCGAAVRGIGETVASELARAWPVTADALDFSGRAGISGTAEDSSCDDGGREGACAARLGNARWDKDLNSSSGTVREGRDGNWSGDFFYRHLGHLPGAWQATREE